MKRLLWAAVLALSIHALFFGFGDRFWHKEIVKPITQPLSFTLVASQSMPETEKTVSPAAKTVFPQRPEPEEEPVLPVVPPPVIEEKTLETTEAPEPEALPEPEKVPEETLPREAPPEPEKLLPEIAPPEPETVASKVEPPQVEKPVKIPKPVRVSPKKDHSVKKKKSVPKKTPKTDPRPNPPEKKPVTTATAPVPPKKMTSAEPAAAVSKQASSGEKTAPPSAPRVVRASPAYATNPRPKYPRVARRRGYEGVVLLKVMVDRKGKVNDLLVLKSSGHEVLDRSALKTVKDWVFEPGTVDGRPMEMWVQVPVRFELKGR